MRSRSSNGHRPLRTVVDTNRCVRPILHDAPSGQIEDTEKMFFDISFSNGEERDVYALTLRELAGDSIELRNAPEYMAGYTPEAEEEEGEGEEDY